MTDTDKSQVVDRNIIRRHCKKVRKLTKKPTKVQSVFFDGKIDKTRLASGKFIKEEHVTMIAEPGHVFISHAIPSGRSNAENVTNAILSSLSDIDISDLNVLGSDGAAANTGYKTGVIRRLEQHLGHKCHWIVCILFESLYYF